MNFRFQTTAECSHLGDYLNSSVGTEIKFHSQFGEDEILHEIFEGVQSGFCVEVGALDGVRHSNTLFFEQLGWNCLLIEANPEMAEACRKNRPSAQVIERAVVAPNNPEPIRFQVAKDIPDLSAIEIKDLHRNFIRTHTGQVQINEIRVRTATIDEILSNFEIDNIHFITIDLEGYEWDALQGFSPAKWTPQIIIIERNEEFPKWRFLKYFAEHGYSLDRRTGVNDWYTYTDRIGNPLLYYANIFVQYFIAPKLIGIKGNIKSKKEYWPKLLQRCRAAFPVKWPK